MVGAAGAPFLSVKIERQPQLTRIPFLLQEAEGLIIRPGGRGTALPKLGLESPTVSVENLSLPKWMQ